MYSGVLMVFLWRVEFQRCLSQKCNQTVAERSVKQRKNIKTPEDMYSQLKKKKNIWFT